jgi:DNA modification methylase
MTPFVADLDFSLYLGDAVAVLGELEEPVAAVVTSPPYSDARDEVEAFEDWPGLFGELRRLCAGPMLFNVGRRWRGGVEWEWWRPLLEGAQEVGLERLDTLLWLKPNANPIQGQLLTDAHEYVLILGRPGTDVNADAIRTEYSPESLARYQRTYAANAGVKGYVRPRHRAPVAGTPNELGARPRSYVAVCVGREKGNPHPSPMPLELALHLVLLASWPGQAVLDPFAGSGTTALACRMLERRSIAVELDPGYAELAARRLAQQSLLVEMAP